MTVAAALLLYVLVVLAAGPVLLSRLAADGIAPRLAITAWLTAIVTVLGCSITAVALILIEAAGHWDSPDALIASCVQRLSAILVGHSGWPAQLVAGIAIAAATGALSAVVIRMVRALSRMRTHTLDHADAVRLVGRPRGGDVVVIEAPEPAGRDRRDQRRRGGPGHAAAGRRHRPRTGPPAWSSRLHRRRGARRRLRTSQDQLLRGRVDRGRLPIGDVRR